MTKIDFKVQSIDQVISSADLGDEGSLVERIYFVLRAQIINLTLPPEMPLVEKEIAAIFNISKTPVREALIRLANDRLVTIVPKSGSYVAVISIERYLEACFIRVSLEGGCVKRLAEKGLSMTEQVTLRSIITQQQQILDGNTTDYQPFFMVDELLHKTFFEYAGLSGAWSLLNSAKAEIDRVRHLKKMLGIHRSKAVIEEHSKILQAIIDREPEQAEAAMIYHIGGVDEEMVAISENPLFLQSIESFNLLLNAQRKGRNKRKWQA
ncbi:GntR family transcriptional regulator [Paraglaciecola sp.]|uniref:GntR family transcriptional regulator n=1 Tax=Paraglaciecola sp. TaxID=1920173 RepID=UPI003EF52542